LLIHAEKNVPYYRSLFREYGFKSAKVQNLDDVKALPYLDKTTVQANRFGFVAENIPRKKLIGVTTSGTSGIPLRLCVTKETEEKHWATVVHLWNRIGYKPGSRTVSLESTAREDGREPFPWQRYGNRLVMSSNYLAEPWVDRFAEMINKFKPEYMVGFPHTIAAFFAYLKSNNRNMCESLKGIIAVAEQVHAWQKDLIQSVTGARLFSDYGMAEKIIHGGGCEHTDAYHFYPQYGIRAVSERLQ
jgi:phenylacetate-CoA ligase